MSDVDLFRTCQTLWFTVSLILPLISDLLLFLFLSLPCFSLWMSLPLFTSIYSHRKAAISPLLSVLLIRMKCWWFCCWGKSHVSLFIGQDQWATLRSISEPDSPIDAEVLSHYRGHEEASQQMSTLLLSLQSVELDSVCLVCWSFSSGTSPVWSWALLRFHGLITITSTQ